MSLKLIQGFYLEEIRRGKARLGTFRVKAKVCKGTFSYTFPFFRFRITVRFFLLLDTEQRNINGTVYHCSVFAVLFRFDITVPFFVKLLHFDTTVPFFFP